MPVPKSCCKSPNCDVQDEDQIYTEVNKMPISVKLESDQSKTFYISGMFGQSQWTDRK